MIQLEMRFAELSSTEASQTGQQSSPQKSPQTASQTASLPEYTVKVSKRARSVSLQVLPLTGLLVTIPARFPRREIPALVEQNREWIEKHLARAEKQVDPEFLQWPPRVLRLRAVEKTLSLVYHGSPQQQVLRGDISGDVLNIYGHAAPGTARTAGQDRQVLVKLLAELLKAEARVHFEPRLSALAARYGLSYKRLSIRGQRTLWGSYSSSGTLSLNYKLLFLPPEFSRYILLHELAHTRYLNHSADFWRFLCRMEPDARRLDAGLNEVGRLVPPWL